MVTVQGKLGNVIMDKIVEGVRTEEEIRCTFEPRHEKNGFLHMQKQRRRSAVR